MQRALSPHSFGLRAVESDDIRELERRLGADTVLADPERAAPYGRDETEDLVFAPSVVVRPDSVEAVAAVVRLASERRLPVVPRGAGTGLSGGALPVCGGIVLALERLNRIREIDRDVLVCVAGCCQIDTDNYETVGSKAVHTCGSNAGGCTGHNDILHPVSSPSPRRRLSTARAVVRSTASAVLEPLCEPTTTFSNSRTGLSLATGSFSKTSRAAAPI